MYLAYLMGTSTSSALEAIYGDPEKDKKKQEALSTGVPSWRADRISFSEEALALAGAQRVEEQTSTQGFEEEDAGLLDDNTAQGAGGASGGGSESSITALENKIKELQQKMVEVQRSNVPDATKEGMLASIEAELNAAIQELNALKTQAVKAA